MREDHALRHRQDRLRPCYPLIGARDRDGIEQISEKDATDTANILLKYRSDIEKVVKEFGSNAKRIVPASALPPMPISGITNPLPASTTMAIPSSGIDRRTLANVFLTSSSIFAR